MTPTVYAAIEKVENYAKEICINAYRGDWDGKDCDIQESKDEQKYYDDIASLEDSLCADKEVKDGLLKIGQTYVKISMYSKSNNVLLLD